MNSVLYCLHNLSQKSHLRRMEKFTQHGDTSCLLHTIAVAYYSKREHMLFYNIAFCICQIKISVSISKSRHRMSKTVYSSLLFAVMPII